MINIVISNDADTRFNMTVILDDVFYGFDGAIQEFSDPQRVLRYADRNKIFAAYISYDFKPTGGIRIAEMLREKHPDIKIIFVLNKSDQWPDTPLLQDSVYIQNPVTHQKVKDLQLI